MIIVKHPYGDGNSSDRYLISLKNIYYLIKITDINEPLITNKYLPKRISTNNRLFDSLNKDNAKYVYQYEFIPGKLLKESVITDTIFVNIINLLNHFFRRGLLIWDCHIDNFIVKKDSTVIYVDLGGIEPINSSKPHYVFDFKLGNEPEEYFYPNYPLSLNTESFTIYWLAYQLKNKCRLNLSIKCKAKLEKMLVKNKNNRCPNFNTILQ